MNQTNIIRKFLKVTVILCLTPLDLDQLNGVTCLTMFLIVKNKFK